MAIRRKQVWRPRTVALPAAPTTPSVRQAQQWAAGDDNPATATLTMTVLAGSSIVVFVTDTYFNSPSAPNLPTLSDTQSGVYTRQGYVTETGYTDAMTLLTRPNVAAGSLSVTCNWTGGSNQWHGVMVAEVSGVSAAPTMTFGSSNVFNPAQTADTIASSNLVLGSSPALLVALCSNFVDTVPADGYALAGTGFTQALTGWNWGGKEGTTSNDSALLESRYYSSPGTVAAKFTPRSPGSQPDGFLTMAIAFQ